MFNGTFLGNLIGFLYFTIFILGGITISQYFFKHLSSLTRLWLGCVMGTVLLMWLPVAISFILGFNTLSHILALVLLLAFVAGSVLFNLKSKEPIFDFSFDKSDLYMLIPVVVMTVFYGIVQASHIMQPSETGSMIFGQSTYADVHIHLSFINGPIMQGTVPFDYNIAPGVQASYPFLSDTISSSIYIWGASLRWAYIIPTIMGAFTIYLGAMLFFKTWLKKLSKAMVAWSLFTFNGGLGFWYFFDGWRANPTNFDRIFENLYETPTNLDGNMIRWVNTFCDMMIPQRATLFGWMMFFAVIYLLYRAVFLKEKNMFIPAGIMAGLTPLISTHIFLAIGIISATWMISRLYTNLKFKPLYAGLIAIGICLIGAILFRHILVNEDDTLGLNTLYPYYDPMSDSLTTSRFDYTILYENIPDILKMYPNSTIAYDVAGYSVLLICGGLIGIVYFALIAMNLFEGKFKELLSTWGLYLGIVLVLALPQLIKFTFGQTSGDGFLEPHFNWVNSKDNYFWFYIKNVGIPALLIIPALFSSTRRMLSVAAPIATLMLLAETFALQPNTYDNNKLIYPAFFLAIGVVANFMVNAFEKMKGLNGRYILAAGVMVTCTLSGALSMGREYVADEYEMFSAPHIEVAEWISENTEKDDIILTEDRFNNSVTGLSGRSVVCGGGWFFSTHGLPGYNELQVDVKLMYTAPLIYSDLFKKHSVDYIMISDYERAKAWNIDYMGILEIADPVYTTSDGSIELYKLK